MATGALIERDGEVAAITAAAIAARDGQGGCVVVEGPAGIGKSRLCAEARSVAEATGLGVLGARGGELEHDVTYGVVRQLFERLLREASSEERRDLLAGSARLATAAIGGNSDLDRISPETGPAHGLYWLVSNLASREPVAIIVDDAHWSDAESLRFLLYLARRLEGLPVLVVIAARPREPDSEMLLVETLAAEPASQRIDLGPLTPEGSALLFEDRGQEASAELVRACHEVSGGNPFYIGELTALVGEGIGAERSELIERVRSMAPPTVQRSIVLRLGHEGEQVRRVAVALAVLGDGTTAGLIAELARLGADEVVDALGVLVDIGLCSGSGTISLAHPIIRTAIYTDVPKARLAALHAAAARALAAKGSSSEEVAHHLALSEPGGDAAACARLLEAGEQALARGAIDTAVRMATRALQEPPPAELRGRVLVTLGEAQQNAGLVTDAVARLREALRGELADSLRSRAALAAAQALAAAGDQLAAIRELQVAGERLAGEHALRVETERISMSLYVIELTQAALAHVKAYAELPGVTPAERVALALAGLAFAFDPGAEAAHVAAIARRALGGGKLVAEQTMDSTVTSNAAYASLFAESFEDYNDLLARGTEDAQRRGSTFAFLNVSLGQLMGAVMRGDVISAVGYSERAIELWPEVGGRLVDQRWTAYGIRFSAEAYLLAGERETSRGIVAAGAALGDLDTLELCLVRYARGLLAASDGNNRAALEDFRAFGAINARTRTEDRNTPWRLGAARAAASIGDTELAVSLADEAISVCERWGAPGGLGSARRVRALVGDRAQISERLEEAIATLRPSVMRLELAETLIDHGMALRSGGHRLAARSALQEGMELAARCASPPAVERARAELRALGARPRRLMFSGVEGLTAAERRVASMASQGFNNREIAQALFVTQKTVENHLTNTYRKLEITSRTELGAALADAA